MNRILLVDDEAYVLQALERTLRRVATAPLVIETFTSPADALLRCAEVDFDVVVSDCWMIELHGIEFLRMVKGIQPDAVRVVLSASTEFDTVMKAVNQAEVFRYLPKPWSHTELADMLAASLVRRAELLDERRRSGADHAAALSPEERETRRLEELEPGITKVRRHPDGSVLLD